MIQFQNENAIVFESSLFQTTSTVILTEDLVVVVDPNWLPGEIEDILRVVETVKADRPVYLLFTHSDYDHIIGWNAFPNAKVIASKAFAQNPEKQKVIDQILSWDDEYYISRNYPTGYPAVDLEVLSDGQIFEIGNTRFTFYLAPGHNPDGIFTIVENKNRTLASAIWIAGDYLSDVEFPYIYHNSQLYENTLLKTDAILKNHPVRLMIPGHGKVATSTSDILGRQKESLSYIHDLRICLENNLEFNTDALWQRYQFRRGMQNFHEENVKLIRKELG